MVKQYAYLAETERSSASSLFDLNLKMALQPFGSDMEHFPQAKDEALNLLTKQ